MGTLKTYHLDLYRDGNYFGGGSSDSGKLNEAFINDLSAKGISSTYGYININGISWHGPLKREARKDFPRGKAFLRLMRR